MQKYQLLNALFAVLQAAVKPYLLYTNSHDISPSLQIKQPTASHPPTSILGSIDLQISATGTAIQVSYAYPQTTLFLSLKRRSHLPAQLLR